MGEQICEQRVAGFICPGKDKCVLAKILDVYRPGTPNDVRNHIGVITKPGNAPNYSGCLQFEKIQDIENDLNRGIIWEDKEQTKLRGLHDSTVPLKRYETTSKKRKGRSYRAEVETNLNLWGTSLEFINKAWSRLRRNQG